MKTTKAPEIRREEILDAAQRLFREQGYEATSISDIVRSVGVAQGTFYYHFPSKEDTLKALGQRITRKLMDELEKVQKREELSVSKKMEAILRMVLDLPGKHYKFRKQIPMDFRMALHHEAVTQGLGDLIKIVSALVEQGTEEGVFSVEHPRETAALLCLLVIELEHRWDFLQEQLDPGRLVARLEEEIHRILGTKESELIQIQMQEKGE